ncbi:MAG: rhodanese-like domain-containing protein [Clostridia bacterium]|nr:rhodanese-like domain-containing protein [Clostridia bacterium]
MNRFGCCFCRNRSRCMDKDDITMEQLENMAKEGAIILDVRSPQEYQEGHIDGAVLIPEYELRITAKEMLKDKKQVIVVYCPSGFRSKRAQRLLNYMGYENVYNLYKGLENY